MLTKKNKEELMARIKSTKEIDPVGAYKLSKLLNEDEDEDEIDLIS